MATSYLPKAITKDVLFERAQERFQEWAKIYTDPTKTAQWMYEDMSCSCYSGCPADDFPDDVKAERDLILDSELCFNYKGYDFELSSCDNTDRYVCWMQGHKDIDSQTKEESDDLENWCPKTYLVNDAWCWGAEFDLKPGQKVNELILSKIDKFLETFKE